MAQIQYIEPLTRAFQHMKRILFEPFDLGKWFVIGFGCWLANLAEGSGNGGTSWTNALSRDTVNGGDFGSWEPWLISLLGCIALFVLALLFVLLWVSSRGRFIFLDNVLANRGAIKEPWARYKTQGNSLFLWQLAFIGTILLALLLAALLVVPFVYLWTDGPQSVPCLALVAGGLLLFVVIVSASFVHLLLTHFVVPIMHQAGSRTTEAWRQFLPLLRGHPGSFIVYVLFVLLLWLGVGMGILTVIVFTCCLAAIPLIIPYIGTVALLPVYITFRAFSLEFLAQFMPELTFFESSASAPGTVLEGD